MILLPVWFPTVVQLVAVALFTVGMFLIALPAGFIAAGVLVGLAGWAIDRPGGEG